MKIIYTLFFIFIFTYSSAAQTAPYLLKIDYPEYIPVNSSFEISAVAKLTDINADTLAVYLFSDSDISVENLICRTFLDANNVELTKENINSDFDKVYKTEIDLTELELGNTLFLQLTFLLKSEGYSNTSRSKIALGVSLNKDIEKDDSEGDIFKKNNENFYDLPVKFYDPQRISGNAIVIDEESKIDFALNPEAEVKNLLIEFWAKFSGADIHFFNILNKETQDTILSLGDNFYQMLSLRGIEEKVVYEDFFLSDEAWNHISIFISPSKYRTEIYANGKILFSMPINKFADLHQLKFELSNNSSEKAYQVDLLKIWDFNNHLELAFRNRSYISFNADSSQLIASFTFDDKENIEKNSKNDFINITINKLQLKKSNAPIFSQAPKLNVDLYNDFYNLEWINRESETPAEFVLEKSVDGKTYFPIFSIKADNEKEDAYVYTDPKEVFAELIYYRVKQINKDGSEIFSSQVKIGQGKQESFILDQNYPNPFNPKTIINIEILRDTELQINIYNLVGMKIAKLYEGSLPEGLHKFTFDGSNQPSGIYFCEVKSPSATQVRKMILTK